MVMLYDGDCAVCNRAVKFVAQREKNIRFASLQGKTVRPDLDEAMRNWVVLGRAAGKNVDSIVFVEGGKAYAKSAALIRIGKKMDGVWKILATMAGALPRPLLDWGYDAFARGR
jgi:predicted DCC family thiol-disulfide oxidoreductase YuxK